MKKLKRLAWFIFKSPQRKMLGFGTLLCDLKGLFSILFGEKSTEPIWVCVGVKDRTKNIHRLVQSLSTIYNNENFALSVHDQGSADSTELELWLKDNWPGKLIWSSAKADFNRSRAFNRAVNQAAGNLVFVCDADMTLPPKLEQQIRKYTRPATAWFPVCQWQLNPNNDDWMWFTQGTGLFSAHKIWHKNSLGYDESITGWGGEDWNQFFSMYKSGMMPVRTRCNGLFHHWHEPTEPQDWKKLF